MKCVRISRTDPAFSKVTLSAILDDMHQHSLSLIWSLQCIEAAGDIEAVCGMSMLDLESACKNSDHGLLISYEMLKRLAIACDYFVDLLIVGCACEDKVPKAYRDTDWEQQCDVIISFEDSTTWRLCSRNPDVSAVFESLQLQQPRP